ncbi:MAG: hypothetical protein FJW34_13860 [Acidobacteria bacterium]|nr:hypothetical protein [Acidobacteriota bacterium]
MRHRRLAFILAAASLALAQADVTLQKAIRKETVEGDLKGAIELYGQALSQAGARDRATAAQALLRMGECHEKLGSAEARKAYERVLREYADQTAPAASARERLAALTRASGATAPGGVVHRLVWSTPTEAWGGVSPDGRWIAFQNEHTDLALHDLVTGQNRLLTNYGPRDQRPGMAYGGVFSPDGRRVAYMWVVYKTMTHEVRVVNVDGTGERVLYRHDKVSRALPRAWTPDGAAIVAGLYRDDLRERQVLQISLSDGAIKVLRAEKGHPGGFVRSMAFSPNARFLAYQSYGDIFSLDLQSTEGRKTPVTLAEYHGTNELMGWTPDGNHILFVGERTGTRDAWLLPVKDGKPAGEPRLVKSALAPVDNSVYGGSNDITPAGFTSTGAFYYGASRTESDAMTVALDWASGRLQGAPVRFAGGFDGSTLGLQWSPDGKSAFCRRGNMLLLRNLDSRSRREIHPRYDDAFEHAKWHPDGKSVIFIGGGWPRKVLQVDLETGATRDLALDLTESEAKNVLRDGASETVYVTYTAVLSHDGKTLYRAMYGTQGAKRVGGRVVARNLASGEEQVVHRTRPDEAVIAGLALSPDGKQLASLNYAAPRDRVYVFAASGENPESPPLYSPQGGSGEDCAAITWSADGKFILAGMNRPPATGELWRIPLGGGPPQKIPLPFMVLDLHAHPDGRRIGITAWKQIGEAWALENFLPKAAK